MVVQCCIESFRHEIAKHLVHGILLSTMFAGYSERSEIRAVCHRHQLLLPFVIQYEVLFPYW